MCGIFGINFKNEVNLKKAIPADIKLLSNLSRSRGQDTFGVCVSFKEDEKIYKQNIDPKQALKREDFKDFITSALNPVKEDDIVLVNGQTRLVTNGTKFIFENNQPIITKNILGVHNGIIVNRNYENNSEKINYEGYMIKSDSLLFFEDLSNLFSKDKENFIENLNDYLKNIDGNYSIYFRIPSLKLNFLTSNCGSLYFSNNDSKLLYASEKNILKKFLLKSKSNYRLNVKNIKKIINQIIIFDDNLKILSNNYPFKKHFIQKNEFKIFDNITFENERRENLQKCTKCILPSTYPFINFDEKGISNYFKNYKKQEYLGEDSLMSILDKYRSKNGEPDCIVGLSGGRDSSYGLHLLKQNLR